MVNDRHKPIMTDEEKIQDYHRLKYEYIQLHQDYKRLKRKQKSK